jgi:DNA-binding transcriptional LysR family regulator
MTALEERLKVRLCQRGRSGFSLTEKGKLIYQASQRLFEALDEFRSEAGAVRNSLAGSLTISIVDNLVTNPACRLHQAIGAFNRRAPEVQISVQVMSPTDLERAVLEGRSDLGLGACGRHSPYLSYIDMFEERQTLYCGRGHPLFERSREVTVADLKNEQFARRAYAAPNRFPAGFRLISTAVADLMDSVAVSILSGRYVGFLPAHFAQQWVVQDAMRPLLESRMSYQNPIYLAMRKTEQKKPVLAAFLTDLYLAQGGTAALDAARPRMANGGARRKAKEARREIVSA